MKKKILTKALGLLLTVVMLAGILPFAALADGETTYTFLNPLGTIEPRRDIPLADRSKVTNILYNTGTRTLRLGISWYYKPLDGEPAVALGQMLKEKWEAESRDVNNTRIPAGLTVNVVTNLTSGLHPWNNKTDATYDNWMNNSDCVIVGVGD